MFELEQRILVIAFMVSFNQCRSLHPHGFQFSWTNFPLSNSYDSILMVVDHLTKMVHFIPYTKTIISKGTTKLFLDHVFRYDGLLKDIICDCGP
jgi:hypothetical protein